MGKTIASPRELRGREYQARTIERFADPRQGDVFHEMFNGHMSVIEVSPSLGVVWHMDGVDYVSSPGEWRNIFTYSSRPGYSLMFLGSYVEKIQRYITDHAPLAPRHWDGWSSHSKAVAALTRGEVSPP